MAGESCCSEGLASAGGVDGLERLCSMCFGGDAVVGMVTRGSTAAAFHDV